MMKRLMYLAVAVAVAATALTLAGGPAGATNIGEEGCTPGYYKNHTDNWLEEPGVPYLGPGYLFGDVFGVDYDDVTLLEALQGGGGRGIAGAHKILARAATAAILNAAHEGLGYPLRRLSATAAGPAIFDAVEEVWGSEDRAAILALASRLDRFNRLGCPLN